LGAKQYEECAALNEVQISSTLPSAIAMEKQHKQEIMICTELSVFKHD